MDFGRARWPLSESDCNKDFVLPAIRNLHVRGPRCQMVVEAHLSRFTFGDISGRILSKLAWDDVAGTGMGWILRKSL